MLWSCFLRAHDTLNCMKIMVFFFGLNSLQLAGVPCEGNLHYWVNPDGSYQEEGMNNVKGKIWDKVWIPYFLTWACLFFTCLFWPFEHSILWLKLLIIVRLYKSFCQATVRMACALLSLPILSDTPKPTTVDREKVILAPFEEKRLNKFLLVGPDRSGTSTIFKQVSQHLVKGITSSKIVLYANLLWTYAFKLLKASD